MWVQYRDQLYNFANETAKKLLLIKITILSFLEIYLHYDFIMNTFQKCLPGFYSDGGFIGGELASLL